MAGKEDLRLVSERGTDRLKVGGVVGGIIFLIAEMASLAIASFGVASGAIIYDAYRHRKEKKAKAHH